MTLFDVIDPHAAFMDETSCISKQDGKLVCHAKDPISSGLSLDGFLPPDHFARTGAEVFSMGAGGSTIALTWHLMRRERGANVPSRIIVSNRSQARLDEIARIHEAVPTMAEARLRRGSRPARQRCGGRVTEAGIARHKRDRTRQGCAGLAGDRCGAISGGRHRLGSSTTAVTLSFSIRRVPRKPQQAPADRGWLDVLHPWLDASHCGGLPHRHPNERPGRSRPLARIAGEVGAVKRA